MQDYQFLKELGTGSFGRVVKVRKTQNKRQFLAMKQIKLQQLSSKQKDNALNEVRLLASIDSPNIISYKSAFFEQFGSTLCILMEYADGGDLSGLIKNKKEKGHRFSQKFIWQVAFDLLKGLDILHTNKIIHRDIKPANIFFVNGVAKIGDLNVSKVLEGKFADTQTGTPYYTSPQIWNNMKYDGKVDIWSLGCLLYELTTLKPPFLAKDFPGLCRKISIGLYDPIPSIYSKSLTSLIRKCLTLKMKLRPSCSQLLKEPIFEQLEQKQEGDIELLDTIKCPKVLKLLHQKLPNCKSSKKIVTMKLIHDDSDRSQQSRQKSRQQKKFNEQRSLKKIASLKKIPLPPQTPLKQIFENKDEKLLQKMKNPMQAKQGYLKLPRISSQKNIF